MNRSKSVIAAMLILGMAMAIFAWWTRYDRSQKVLSTWGRDAVVAIRSGERVELLRLSPVGEDEMPRETVVVKSNESVAKGREQTAVLGVREVKDISRAPGLIHARHHLLHEKGFNWNAPADDCQPRWDVALRFTHGDDVATMLFDFDCNRARLLERDAEVNMQPIATALRKFLSGL